MDITNETFEINASTKAVTHDSVEVPAPDRNQYLVYAGVEVTELMEGEADTYLSEHPGYGTPQRLAWVNLW